MSEKKSKSELIERVWKIRDFIQDLEDIKDEIIEYLRIVGNLDENADLGENSTFAHDFSKNQNHGTLLSGAQWSTGKYGKGLSFDGSGAYMDCGTKDSFISTRGTIQFWFKVI